MNLNVAIVEITVKLMMNAVLSIVMIIILFSVAVVVMRIVAVKIIIVKIIVMILILDDFFVLPIKYHLNNK